MGEETKVPTLSDADVGELAYRLYLYRMGMTPETSRETIKINQFGKVMVDDFIRRRNSESLKPLVWDTLKVAYDLALIDYRQQGEHEE